MDLSQNLPIKSLRALTVRQNRMTKILLFGAGTIGAMITELLTGSGDYHVTVVDKDELRLNNIPDHSAITKVQQYSSTPEHLHKLMGGHFAAISAFPYSMTPIIATAAKTANIHYLDLTEDIASTRAVRELAAGAKQAFIPQCGLAPGFISIAAHNLTEKFDHLQKVHMRVGALPIYPTNALKYNLTWSTDGLINEYCNPCEAIHAGETREVLPLEELEAFSLDGINYEAFNTSGGLGTLCESLAGKVESLNYKTVRYPGHRDIVKMLVHDLRLSQRRDILKDVLENAIPATMQDVVLIFITVSGTRGGRLMQESYAKKIYHQEIGNTLWSAIQITTGSSICTVLDLLRTNSIPNSGFVKQEQIPLDKFITNRFGRYFQA